MATPTTNRHPDRFPECREAMATEVTDIALAAVEAGWQPEEVVAALVDLADHMMLGMIAKRDISQDLAFLRKR